MGKPPRKCQCGHPFVHNRMLKAAKVNGFVHHVWCGTHFKPQPPIASSLRERCYKASRAAEQYNKGYIVMNNDRKTNNVDKTIIVMNNGSWPVISGQDRWHPPGQDTGHTFAHLPAHMRPTPLVETVDCWQPPPTRRCLGGDEDVIIECAPQDDREDMMTECDRAEDSQDLTGCEHDDQQPEAEPSPAEV
jgi:hypothetical protein